MKTIITLIFLSTSLQMLAMDEHRNYVVFIGNPGTGKSALINTLVGKNIAKSGLSVRGITTELQQIEHDGLILLDTPGLADIEIQEQAALEIEKSLKFNGFYRIFFVLNIKSGRIIEKDCDTINRVMRAINNYKKDFHIIFNNINKMEKKKIFEDNIAYLSFSSFLEAHLESEPKSITTIDLDIDLEDMNHNFISLRAEDRQFFMGGSEAFYLSSDQVGKIMTEAAENKKREAEIVQKELEEKRLRQKYQEEERRKAQVRRDYEQQKRQNEIDMLRRECLLRQYEDAERIRAQARRDYEVRQSEFERERLLRERRRLELEFEEAQRKKNEAQRNLEYERQRYYESQRGSCSIL